MMPFLAAGHALEPLTLSPQGKLFLGLGALEDTQACTDVSEHAVALTRSTLQRIADVIVPMTFAICRNWALSPDLSAVIEVTERLEELVRFAPLGFLVLERMIRLYHWA